MNLPQGEVVSMLTTSQPNEEAHELIRSFHQTNTMLPILSYKDMTGESIKPVVSMLAGYEANHESPPFSINDAKDVTVNLICVTAAI